MFYCNRFLRKQNAFKKLDKKKYIVWSDAESHFRSQEFISYLFDELAMEKIQVNYNLFAECHGKSSRDAHFSIIGNFIKQDSMKKQLTSTNDIINAILSGQKKSNLWRAKLGLEPIQTLAFEHKNLKSYYNFFNDSNCTLKTVIFSDLKEEFLTEYKVKKIKKNHTENDFESMAKETKVEKKEMNYKGLI